MTRLVAEGPYFDQIQRGQTFDGAPGVTLNEGLAAAHQAIAGDRLRLPLDHSLSRAVTGGVLANPALVWNVAIGQSTLATHHVKANLFYRGLTFHRVPFLGDTLRTVTTVVGLRENQRKEGRPPTGLAALRIVTVDQDDRTVLDFHRCAMIPLRDPAPTGHADDLSSIGTDDPARLVEGALAAWDLSTIPALPSAPDIRESLEIEVGGGDVVSSAPELARLTLNVAKVHHDAQAAGGRRLVYGGHTIAIALSQLTRALPQLLTVPAWEGCDHVGPVHEGDTLRSAFTIGRLVERTGGGALVEIHCLVRADELTAADPGHPNPDGRLVLDWRFTALVAR